MSADDLLCTFAEADLPRDLLHPIHRTFAACGLSLADFDRAARHVDHDAWLERMTDKAAAVLARPGFRRSHVTREDVRRFVGQLDKISGDKVVGRLQDRGLIGHYRTDDGFVVKWSARHRAVSRAA